MPEQCTMYCRVKDCESLEERLGLLAPISIELDEGKPWSTCTCKTSGGVLRISRKVFVKQADDFSRLVGQTMVYFDAREEANPEGVKKVLAHLEDTALIFGIVVDPDFESIANVHEFVTWMAVEYDGLIFNGSEMLDFQGSVIA